MSNSDSPERTPLVIIVKPKGTIVVEGPVLIRDPDGNEIVPPPFKQPGVVKFCGCGRSATRPFCDGSHKREDGGKKPED